MALLMLLVVWWIGESVLFIFLSLPPPCPPPPCPPPPPPLLKRLLECANACALSNNKNVRLSVVTAILNTSSYMHATSSCTSADLSSSATLVIDIVKSILLCNKYESESIVRALLALGLALGTVLLLPCRGDTKIMIQIAKERNIGPMVEKWVITKLPIAVADDIMRILS